MNQKRQMWVMLCIVWSGIWAFLGLFVWPFLFLAAASGLMVLVPIGVSDTPRAPQHDANAWRNNSQ